jgi:hypothetical protein
MATFVAPTPIVGKVRINVDRNSGGMCAQLLGPGNLSPIDPAIFVTYFFSSGRGVRYSSASVWWKRMVGGREAGRN